MTEEYVEFDKLLWTEKTIEDKIFEMFPGFEDEVGYLLNELNSKGKIEHESFEHFKKIYSERVEKLKEAKGRDPEEAYVEEHPFEKFTYEINDGSGNLLTIDEPIHTPEQREHE